MSEEIQELVNQVNSYQEEKSQFESIQTDLILEKEALEEVVLKLRNQIKETEEALSATQGLHVSGLVFRYSLCLQYFIIFKDSKSYHLVQR